jgi:hypothetical protein
VIERNGATLGTAPEDAVASAEAHGTAHAPDAAASHDAHA